MHIAGIDNVSNPIYTSTGEIIYELVGAAQVSGAAQKHSVAVVVIAPGKSSAAHHHLVSEETYYILRGQARMVIDDRTFELGPGQACLIEPFERHQISNIGDGDLEFVAVCAPPWQPDDSIFA